MLTSRMQYAIIESDIYDPTKNTKIIGIKTINGVGASSKLFLLKPERFILYSDKKKNKHNIDVTLGVSEADFDCSADMLLPPSLIGG